MSAPDPAERDLIDAARDAQTRAVAPYSHFHVGAALRLRDGRIVTGCNVENATYGLTVCAERVALLKALSDGEREFTAIAVTADAARPTPPCGACRQLLWEYCGDIPVIMANAREVTMRTSLGALLPEPFGPQNLQT
ncbi:MAG: cytidine deaminase [Acidobacteriota bacterium]|nr:cytidine deaminase [Acidobacteriota bacterium]